MSMREIKTEKKELLIGLISDTHCPSKGEVPPEIIKEFKEKEIDYLFHLGDYCNWETYKLFIDEFGKDKFIGISGNMDNDKQLKKEVPETQELEIFGHKIFMTHGMGGPNMIIRRLNKNFDLKGYDIVIFGHVHRPYNEKKDGRLYLSPGTPSDKRFTDINSYGYLKISKDKIDPTIIQI
ncbi:MAG: metallophosphoesterase family protein [Promethearchaeia archaeon]